MRGKTLGQLIDEKNERIWYLTNILECDKNLTDKRIRAIQLELIQLAYQVSKMESVLRKDAVQYLN